MLRDSIKDELEAINLYEKYAEMTDNPKAKAVFQEVADDEKHHVHDFLEVLLEHDKVQRKELKKEAIMKLGLDS